MYSKKEVKSKRRLSVTDNCASEPVTCPECGRTAPPVRWVGPAFQCASCGALLMIGKTGKWIRFVPFAKPEVTP